jgi:hypothetical protein
VTGAAASASNIGKRQPHKKCGSDVGGFNFSPLFLR